METRRAFFCYWFNTYVKVCPRQDITQLYMKRLAQILGLIICCYAFASEGSEILQLQWNDLVPKEDPKENPLTGLSEMERAFAEWIIHLRGNLPENGEPKYQDMYAEMDAALPELERKGIDVDKIIAQRRLQKTAINTDLKGRLVRLPGYLLPLEFSGTMVTEFLLVPYVGACIHAPPPPPNQIVHVKVLANGGYKSSKYFDPIMVTGVISAKEMVKDLFLVDGSAGIRTVYTMEAVKIEPYKG